MHQVSPHHARHVSPAGRRKNRSNYRQFLIEPLENRQLLSTYYVATSGSDSASGASASPFKTIQKAASVLRAGDTLNIRAGSYAGLDASGLSGTQSAPITIQADPAATPGSVVINSPDDQSDGITVDGSQWLTIQGLTVKASAMSRDGIRIVSGSNNTSIVNCDVSGANRFGLFASGSSNVRIEGSYLHDNPGDGSAMTGHDAYITGGCINAIFRGNTVARAGSQGLHMNADGGAVSGALVENNTFIDNVNNGINCDGVTNSRFQNNLIYGSTKHGISMYHIDGATGSTGNVIVNNTIIDSTGSGAAIQLSAASTGNTIFNNVLLGGTDGAISVSSDSRAGLTSDYNAVSNKFTNGTVQTLTQWRSSTGLDNHSFTFTTSAAFVNAAGNDYHLLSTSPLKDVGIGMLAGDVAAPLDMEGTSRPQNGFWDIGSYEFGAVAADTAAPTANNLAAAGVTVGGAATYTFTVTYGDNVAINVASLGSGDVRVTGPNGFNQTATFVSVDVNSNGAPRTATYRINTPGGAWDVADNGTYTVTLAAGEVTDTSGNAVAAGSLGTFGVNISSGIGLILSGAKVANVSAGNAAISWSTNLGADSQVAYGTTTAYGSTTALDSTMVTTHGVTLNGLMASQTYHFQVKSRDALGNLTASADMTFTTLLPDLNGDGIVNFNDMLVVTGNWGRRGTTGPLTMAQGDANGDGVVDFNDMLTITGNWNRMS